MHVHDRTLISSLGFRDPDKADARHDRACQYLVHLAKTGGLDRLVKPLIEGWAREYEGGDYRGKFTYSFIGFEGIVMERMIGKGQGQYHSTIGFLDVVARAMYSESFVGEEKLPCSGGCKNK